MRHLIYAAALIATPAVAGVEEAVNDYILPHLAAFTEAAEVLDDAAQANCEAEGLVGPYNAAFDGWMAVADVRLGPSEQGALSLSFWPDKRGFTERTLADLISNKDPVVEDQAAFEEISIAARGFFALERMLYDSQFNDYAEGDYACTLVRALTRDVVDQATALQAQWNDFAPLLLDPGSAGNTTYLDEAEAQRAILRRSFQPSNSRKTRGLGDRWVRSPALDRRAPKPGGPGAASPNPCWRPKRRSGWPRLWPTGNSPKPVRRSTPFASRPKP